MWEGSIWNQWILYKYFRKQSFENLCLLQEEAPYFREVMDEVNQKLKDLTELNKNKSIPSLSTAQRDIQIQFDKAASTGNEVNV